MTAMQERLEALGFKSSKPLELPKLPKATVVLFEDTSMTMQPFEASLHLRKRAKTEPVVWA